jgi:hypothetical protein
MQSRLDGAFTEDDTDNGEGVVGWVCIKVLHQVRAPIRRIWRAFTANPGAELSTGDLVRWAYPRLSGRTLNNHRFAIRRAAEAVADRAGKGWRDSIIWRAKPPAAN